MVGCLLFCVDVTDGAQQCSVLQVISSDIDGILHRHSLLLRGVRLLVVGCFRSFRFHKERCTTVHLLLHTHSYLDKKILLLYIFVSSTLIY